MDLSNFRVNNLRNPRTLLSILLNLSLILLALYPFLSPKFANATVTEAFVRFDRLSTGAAISGTACLKTGTTGTETNVVIVFPIGWTISGTASNWTVTTTNLPKDPVGGGTATAWPGIGTASSVSGLSVVFPGTDLTTTTFYCFNFAGASSTVGSAGNDKTGQLKTQGGSPYVDSVNYATSVVSSGGEQITVTASVSATMTFSLSGGNSQDLGTLSTSTTANGSPTIVQHVSTNARNGWISWVKSANATLHSAAASADISSPGSYDGTPQTLSSTGGYVLKAAVANGSPTVAPEYLTSGSDDGGHLDTTFNQLASYTAPVADDQINLITRARAGSTTPAATDYTDTLTITAAGSF